MQMRPDIQYPTGTLAQFNANPRKPHPNALKRVLHYIKGTTHFGLMFGGKRDKTDLIRWTDSDLAQDPDTQ
jgi:hypothetical protein